MSNFSPALLSNSRVLPAMQHACFFIAASTSSYKSGKKVLDLIKTTTNKYITHLANDSSDAALVTTVITNCDGNSSGETVAAESLNSSFKNISLKSVEENLRKMVIAVHRVAVDLLKKSWDYVHEKEKVFKQLGGVFRAIELDLYSDETIINVTALFQEAIRILSGFVTGSHGAIKGSLDLSKDLSAIILTSTLCYASGMQALREYGLLSTSLSN